MIDAISHRSTTSSRRPGVAVEGSVHVKLGQCVRCEVCGGIRRVYVVPQLPHATRWVERDGAWIRIDCSGDEVF